MFNLLIDNSAFILLLLKASGVTLLLAFCALIIGLLLAFIFLLLESATIKWLAKSAALIVMALRGLPEILVIVAIYNGLPMLLNVINDGITINFFITTITFRYPVENFDISPFFCGIAALSLLYAAYASKTLKGAFQAISIDQWQAAQSLGMNKRTTLIHIIIPQTWHYALPGLGNQWLVLLKDTALVSLIAVNDIMMQTRSIITQTRQPFIWYLVAAALYLAISIVSQQILKKLAHKAHAIKQEVDYA